MEETIEEGKQAVKDARDNVRARGDAPSPPTNPITPVTQRESPAPPQKRMGVIESTALITGTIASAAMDKLLGSGGRREEGREVEGDYYDETAVLGGGRTFHVGSPGNKGKPQTLPTLNEPRTATPTSATTPPTATHERATTGGTPAKDAHASGAGPGLEESTPEAVGQAVGGVVGKIGGGLAAIRDTLLPSGEGGERRHQPAHHGEPISDTASRALDTGFDRGYDSTRKAADRTRAGYAQEPAGSDLQEKSEEVQRQVHEEGPDIPVVPYTSTEEILKGRHEETV